MKNPDYLRRTDTVLARTINRIAPERGEAWRQSRKKRILDKVLAIPVYVASLPLSTALKAGVLLEDGRDMYFRDQRLGQDLESTVEIVKIRTMHPDSHAPDRYGSAGCTDDGGNFLGASQDPRVTRVGRLIRPHDLEELPQLADVIRGRLSLVGIRATGPIDYERLTLARKEAGDIAVWEASYQADRPSLIHLHAMDELRKSNVNRRFHFDNFYARNASLGLDLYIMYQATRMILKNRRSF